MMENLIWKSLLLVSILGMKDNLNCYVKQYFRRAEKAIGSERRNTITWKNQCVILFDIHVNDVYPEKLDKVERTFHQVQVTLTLKMCIDTFDLDIEHKGHLLDYDRQLRFNEKWKCLNCILTRVMY